MNGDQSDYVAIHKRVCVGQSMNAEIHVLERVPSSFRQTAFKIGSGQVLFIVISASDSV